jgi:tRNA nucleotidyltransferase (CCA-adding enzyme)
MKQALLQHAPRAGRHAEAVLTVGELAAMVCAVQMDTIERLPQPERFEQLLCVCTCDYAAYPGHVAAGYPKAPRLRQALAAYAGTDVQGLDAAQALDARAAAIALRLRPPAA